MSPPSRRIVWIFLFGRIYLPGAEPVDEPAARSPCRRRAYAAYASWPCLWTHRVASLFWVFAGAGFFWLWIRFFLIAANHLTRYSYAPA